MLKMRYITFAAMLAAVIAAVASPYRFRPIESSNGLSNNKINSVLKDSTGFVWIGTSSGLNRYDGFNIKVYSHLADDSLSLHDNFVEDLQLDDKGRIWVCAAGRYALYNPEKDEFDQNPDEHFRAMGFNGSPTRIAADGKRMWLYSRKEGLHMWDGNTGKTLKFPDLSGGDRDITYIYPVPGENRTVVVDSEGTVSVIDAAQGKVVSQTRMPAEARAHCAVFTVFAEKEGPVWVYSENGVYLLDPKSNTWVPNELTDMLRGHSVTAVTQDKTGKLWVGLDNEGLIVMDKSGGITTVKTNPNDPYSIGNNAITTFFADDDGTMWVGTYKKGVAVYNESEFKFDLDILPDVNCIAADPNEAGAYWIGTDTNGLIKWNRRTGESKKLSDMMVDGHPVAIVAVEPSRDGSLWIGTYRGGLKRYRNGAVSQVLIPGLGADSNVWAVLENPDGTVWIGSLGEGIFKWDPATGKILVKYDKENSPLRADYISCFARGNDGKVYVGNSEGLYAIDPLSGTLTMVDEKVFGKLQINQVYIDSRGWLWVAARTGLYVYNPETKAVDVIEGDNSLKNTFIQGVVEDNAHTMWVTTGNSIVNVKVSEDFSTGEHRFDYHAYTHKDGLQDCAFNQRTLCVLDNGDVVAGGLFGLNRISPTKIKYNFYKPNVIFTRLFINNQPVEVDEEIDGRVILSKALWNTDRIKLRHDQNSFSVDFATDSHVQPDYTQFVYRLQGFNDKWVTGAPGMHEVTYTNLAPGSYRLSVKAINSDGVPSDSETTLIIDIAHPWWNTWWMRVLYVLAFVGVVYVLYMRMKANERRRFILRQKEEMAEKQEELNQMKFRFYTNVSHELRTPLTLILSPVESMLKDSDNDERTTKRLSVIHDNAKKLLYLVNQLLDFRKSEVAALTFNGSVADMVDFVRAQVGAFAEHAEKRNISLDFFADCEHLDMVIDADKMTKVITNLLSNAFKFTPDGGKITVSLLLTGNMLRIIVADNGKGIKDEDKLHVFDRFYQSSDNGAQHGGSGIGLNLVKEYVRLHQGDVWVTDTKDGGATINIDIPVKRPESLPLPAGESQELSKPVQESVAPAKPEKLPTALLVDDNKDLIEFMKDELADEYNVIVAYNGAEALEKLAETPVDIIVSDIMMPVMDGIELCRRLKADKKTLNIPLVIVTAKQDVRTVVEGLTLGADEYITKPFNNEVLKLRMRKLVDLKRRGSTRALIEPEPSQVKITSLDEKFIERAVKYVEDNISRSDLSVEELSRELGMSRVHLYKKILQLTGKTPIEFIRILRLKRAAQYLRESQLNVSEIAYQLGFNNPKYFSKYFIEEYGISPSEYQKKEGV